MGVRVDFACAICVGVSAFASIFTSQPGGNVIPDYELLPFVMLIYYLIILLIGKTILLELKCESCSALDFTEEVLLESARPFTRDRKHPDSSGERIVLELAYRASSFHTLERIQLQQK